MHYKLCKRVGEWCILLTVKLIIENLTVYYIYTLKPKIYLKASLLKLFITIKMYDIYISSNKTWVWLEISSLHTSVGYKLHISLHARLVQKLAYSQRYKLHCSVAIIVLIGFKQTGNTEDRMFGEMNFVHKCEFPCWLQRIGDQNMEKMLRGRIFADLPTFTMLHKMRLCLMRKL